MAHMVKNVKILQFFGVSTEEFCMLGDGSSGFAAMLWAPCGQSSSSMLYQPAYEGFQRGVPASRTPEILRPPNRQTWCEPSNIRTPEYYPSWKSTPQRALTLVNRYRYNVHTYLHTYIATHINMNINVSMNINMFIHMSIPININGHININTYLHTYIQYSHMYTHIYIGSTYCADVCVYIYMYITCAYTSIHMYT